MKGKYKFCYMLDLLVERKAGLMLGMLVIALCFYLYDITATSAMSLNYEKRLYEEVFCCGVDQVATLTLSVRSESELMSLSAKQFSMRLESLSACDEVKALGTFATVPMIFLELYQNPEYQKIMMTGGNTIYDAMDMDQGRSRYAHVLSIDRSMLQMIDSPLEEEIPFTSEETYIPIFPGASFRDILQIGDVLTANGEKYKVAGFLKKDAKWPPEVAMGLGAAYYHLRSMDRMFLIYTEDRKELTQSLTDQIPQTTFIRMSSVEGYAALQQWAKKQSKTDGIEYQLRTIKDYLEESNKENAFHNALYAKLLLVMFFICVFTATSSAVISMMLQRRTIGIWYANGMLETDVLQMLLLQQLVRLGIPLLGVILYRTWQLNHKVVVESFVRMHQQVVLPRMCLLAAVAFAMMTLVPWIYLKRQNIISLLKARD